MIGNPEFRRNLWLEFTSSRVLVTCLLVGIVIAAGAGFDFIAYTQRRAPKLELNVTAQFAFYTAAGLVLLWGGRLAADAVVQEMRERTWDGQRMSTLSPWALTWGKLLGAPSVPWTFGLFSLAVYAFATSLERPIATIFLSVASLLGIGLFCHAIGLLLSLVRLSAQPGETTRRTNYLHFVALGLSLALYSGLSPEIVRDDRRWYGLEIDAQLFAAASIWYFALWAVVGAYRLMRRELQMRSAPWVWPLFLASLIAYGEGFAVDGERLPVEYLLPGAIVALFVYALHLLEPTDAFQFRRVGSLLASGHILRAAEESPLWLVTYVLLWPVAIGGIAFGGEAMFGGASFQRSSPALMIGAGVLFVTRDLCLALALRLGRESRMAPAYGAIFWVLLYGVLPPLFARIFGPDVLPAFYPNGLGDPVFAILIVSVQVAVGFGFLWWRWRAMWRAVRPIDRSASAEAAAARH